MKKLLALILLVASLAACTRALETPEAVCNQLTIIGESASSRFAATQDTTAVNLAWTAGDEIGVFSSNHTEGNYPYYADPDAANPTSAHFYASSSRIFGAESGADYYAYCPYDANAGSNPRAIAFSLSSNQDQSAAGSLADAEKHELLVSAPFNTGADGGTVRFSFKPLLPLVQFNLGLASGESIEIPVRSLSLVSDAALAGEGSLDIASATPVISLASSQNTVAMVPHSLKLTPGGSVPVHFVTLPGAHTALKLRLEAIDNSVCEIALPAVTFGAGCNYIKDVSCTYADFVAPPMVDITPAALSCNAGEALEFSISGAASEIDFWSGEKQHELAYADKYRSDSLSFMHATGAGYQLNAVTVRVSEDFSGVLTEEAIKAATWTDISNRFTFSTTAGPNHADNPFTKSLDTYNDYFVYSGKKDITDCYGPSGKMYLAFFYHIDAYVAANDNSRTMHYLTKIEVPGQYSLAQDNTTLIAGSNYNPSEDKNNVPAWQTPKTELGIPGDPGFRFAAAFKPTSDRDAYAVVNSPLVRSGHDTPIVVQSSSQDTPDTFSYVFAEPGTYEVNFIARRPRLDGAMQSVTKTFTITVN